MKGIPPEIDRLLWAVAEDPGVEAGDEFVRRYPQYAGELARRRNLVRGLKNSRPKGKVGSEVRPRVAYRRTTKRSTPRGLIVAVSVLGFAAVAAAAYTLALFTAPQKAVVIRPQTKPIPIQDEEPRVTPPPDVKTPPEVAPDNPPPDEPLNEEEPDANAAIRPTPVDEITFRVRGADIESALIMLGEQAKVRIVVAPGMPKMTVEADYRRLPLASILADMGERYGFTAFDQGDGSVIVVPAVERDLAPKRDVAPVDEHVKDETKDRPDL
jgi:hypothetical protein